MLHCLPCGVGDVGFSLELSFGDDFTSIIIYVYIIIANQIYLVMEV